VRPARLALVGFGKWGRNYVRAARESGEAEVVQIILRAESRNLADAEATGIPTKAAAEIDAYVYTGHPSSAALFCEVALAAGRPILCEKPAGLSLEDARRIARAEEYHRHGGLVLVGHQHLFAEGFEMLREMGPHPWAEARFAGPVARDYSFVWDYGPHAVSALLALGVPTEGGVDGQRWYVAIQDAKEARVLAPLGGRFIAYDAYASSAEPPLTRQVRAFARAVRAGGTDDYRFGARWAVDVARVLERARV
jgi:predicted dehydrogenase